MKHYEKMNTARNESGVVLIAVVCFTAIAAVLAIGLMSESSSQLKIAKKNVSLEQAFYVAEGGAERAVSYIRQNGVTAATCITGSIGNGNYMTFIVPTPGAGAGDTHSLGGSLEINPNNSPDNEFLLVKPDGTSITRDDLANDTTAYDSEPCVYYTGPAMLIHVKPKGAGNQNTLIIDSVVYTLNNGTTYDFVGDMNVVVQNDSRNNGNHQANGHWQLGSISGNDVTLFDGSVSSSTGTEQYEVRSIGTVEGVCRNVIMEGIHQESWAKYALWYNSGPGAIWIKSGEVFNGPVHANTFIYLQGNPIFNDLISSAQSTWGSGSDTSAVSFNMGYLLNASSQSMASVTFSNFLPNANLVVTGLTNIRLSGTNMVISNTRRSWTNNIVPIISNYVVYARSVSPAFNSTGMVNIGGTLDGRLTIVTDYDIQITNHVTYAVHPTNNSDDALGLIAGRDVIVTTLAPSNLNLFAHIMAVGSATASSSDGSFRVEDYAGRTPSGLLNVYGGIVQYYRGAVGTFNPWTQQTASGFAKNYAFDTRFETAPPPEYPTLTNEYTWTGWREK